MFFTRVVIDQSGSMSGKETEVINAVNRFTDQLAREPVDQALSLAFFDSAISVVRDFQSLAGLKPLKDGDYKPSGDTSLYDAIGSSIADLEEKVRLEGHAVLAIVTDGGETSSRHYTLDEVKRLIREKKRSGRWTILFLALDDTQLRQDLVDELDLDPDDVMSGSRAQLVQAMRQLAAKVRGFLMAPR